MNDENCCDLCGDEIKSEDTCEIDSIASEYFMLDTGTIVHKECFSDSRPLEYIRRLEEFEEPKEELDFF